MCPSHTGFVASPPKEMRENVAGMVSKWNNMYYSMKGLSNLAGPYLLQGPDLERIKT